MKRGIAPVTRKMKREERRPEATANTGIATEIHQHALTTSKRKSGDVRSKVWRRHAKEISRPASALSETVHLRTFSST